MFKYDFFQIPAGMSKPGVLNVDDDDDDDVVSRTTFETPKALSRASLPLRLGRTSNNLKIEYQTFKSDTIIDLSDIKIQISCFNSVDSFFI